MGEARESRQPPAFRLVAVDWELIEIARAITTEREIDKLLGLILEKARFVTGADAGSMYVVEGDDPDLSRNQLRFKLSQNDSLTFDSSEFTMPLSPRSMPVEPPRARHREVFLGSSGSQPGCQDLTTQAPVAPTTRWSRLAGHPGSVMSCRTR